MKILSFLVVFVFCQSTNAQLSISKVTIETILSDSLLNVRALEIKGDQVYFASADGRIGVLKKGSNKFDFPFIKDKTNKPHYRSLAIAGENVFTLSIGSPALLYKNGKIVYQEDNKKAFYDSMEFWNEKEGIAIGDPTDECMSIIITRDGGDSWQKLPCSLLPKSKEGEAAFAASDGNIAIKDDLTWVATGGKNSRIIHSSDKGKSWTAIDIPIVQGKGTTGLYAIDFYDEKLGFGIGGDYTDPKSNIRNKISTKDGGKTWVSIGSGSDPGYRSCVKYLPNGQGKALVAVGFEGIDYSNDGGKNWKHLSDEGFYTIRFLDEKTAYAAGKGRVSKLTFE